jgi:hypothetical protein
VATVCTQADRSSTIHDIRNRREGEGRGGEESRTRHTGSREHMRGVVRNREAGCVGCGGEGSFGDVPPP